jgi:membrane-bound ClpP family serine protease
MKSFLDKFLEPTIPAVLSFGPIFMVIGLSMGGNGVFALIGALMVSTGSMLLLSKIDRLRKDIAELNKQKP